jgi:hypothetical protein
MRPTELKIQGVQISLHFDDELLEREVGDKPIRALPDYRAERILVQTGLPFTQEREEVLEAVLQMVYFYYTAELDGMRPRIIGQLARGLLQVLRDNPELGRYLTKDGMSLIGFHVPGVALQVSDGDMPVDLTTPQ